MPSIPDTDPQSEPRGIAVRFHHPNSSDGKRVHTDIVAHSVPLFPARTGQEFYELLTALTTGKAQEFLGSHPSALAFVTAPKPFTQSFATAKYYALSAIKLTNAEGKTTYVRYRFVPEAGAHSLSAEEATAKGPNYLFEELPSRLSSGPVKFKLVAQVGEDGDVTDDITKQWPEERKQVELGEVVVEGEVPAAEQREQQKQIIFDPVPRVDGLEPSEDPLLDTRANMYLISGRERRAAA